LALEEKLGSIVDQRSLSTVGAVVSSDLITQALVLILVGSIGILLWITYRFRDVKMGATALVALLHRNVSGQGQHIDVNMVAAANVTTEAGSYTWMVNGGTVQRQTGRQVMMVAEAWVDPDRLPLYLRPDEYHQSFNFEFLETEWEVAPLHDAIDGAISAAAAVGSTPTWTLSNHDVMRHATRYGLPAGTKWREWPLSADHATLATQLDAGAGLRRARAATTLLLALPGSVYIYQGEELGLPEVWDLPVDVLDDIGEGWTTQNAEMILRHFGANKVAMSIDGAGTGGSYSKDQGYYVFKELFKATVTRKFVFIQIRKSNDEGTASFAIAERRFVRRDDGRQVKDKVYIALHIERGEDTGRWVLDEIKSIR